VIAQHPRVPRHRAPVLPTGSFRWHAELPSLKRITTGLVLGLIALAAIGATL
jgi:hypothetical protein